MKKMYFENENGGVMMAQKATCRQIYGDGRTPKKHYEYLGFSGNLYKTSAGVIYGAEIFLFKNNKNQKYYYITQEAVND